MAQAITTKYHGPHGKRGARISARAKAGRRVYPYDHGASLAENHKLAARAFATEMKWTAYWYSGTLWDETMCHVTPDISAGGLFIT